MARSVLVTGGARRIGRAIVETLAAQGWRVLVHARRADDDEGRELAAQLKGDFLFGDLAAKGAADCLFQEAVGQAPDLCAVVNNASMFSLAANLPEHDAQALWRVNAEVPQRLTELLHAHLQNRGGAVVDLLDTRILPPAPAAATPYEASKRALADSLAPRARRFADLLRVNAVAPGPVLKPSLAANSELGGETLLPTRPTVADVAAAVAYLLSAESVTGQIIAVDSGQSLLRVLPFAVDINEEIG